MFDPEQGSDNEMLERKCESIGMEVPDGPYSVLGIFDIAAVKRNDAESDYWGDPRFLCNRRNAFNWKRDKSSKHTLGPNARRFVKQLLFGKLDVPASRLDSSYYQPKMYTRIVLSNLRKLCLEKKKAVNAEEAEKPIAPVAASKDEEYWIHVDDEPPKDDEESPSLFNIPPEMYHFLDLASFFEPKASV